MHPTVLIKYVLLLILLNGAAVSSAQAASLAYQSGRMSRSGEDSWVQFGMLIEERAGDMLLTSRYSLGVPSSINDIYFDDPQTALIGSNAIGVHAELSDESGTQSTAPQDARNNEDDTASKWLSFLGPWANTFSFDGLIAALTNNQSRVELHLQDIGLAGTADTDINQPDAVSRPAAAWIFFSALLGFIVIANRQKV